MISGGHVLMRPYMYYRISWKMVRGEIAVHSNGLGGAFVHSSNFHHLRRCAFDLTLHCVTTMMRPREQQQHGSSIAENLTGA